MKFKHSSSLLISLLATIVMPTVAIAQTANTPTENVQANLQQSAQSQTSVQPAQTAQPIQNNDQVPATGKSIDVSNLIDKGQINEALAQLDAFLLNNPKDILALYQKGVALPAIGRINEAIAIFSELAQMQPRIADIHNNLGVLLSVQGNLPGARAALEKAVDVKPEYAVAYNNLGDVYVKMANGMYEKSLGLDPAQKTVAGKINALIPITKPGLASELANSTKVATTNQVVTPANTASASKAITTKTKVGKTVIAPVDTASATVVTQPNTASTANAESTVGAVQKSEKTEKAQASKEAKEQAKANTQEITNMLKQWLSAWSKKDVDGYLSFYAPNITSNQNWKADRKNKISSKKSIDVTVQHVKVAVKDDKAMVKFTQNYVSDQFKEVSSKTLMLVKIDNNWKISQER